MDPLTKLVLFTTGCYADDKGDCNYESVDELAANCGLTPDTVAQHFTIGAGLGWFYQTVGVPRPRLKFPRFYEGGAR
jgi:hypothetical protein